MRLGKFEFGIVKGFTGKPIWSGFSLSKEECGCTILTLGIFYITKFGGDCLEYLIVSSGGVEKYFKKDPPPMLGLAAQLEKDLYKGDANSAANQEFLKKVSDDYSKKKKKKKKGSKKRQSKKAKRR